jgi:hypothetical protein
MQYLILKLEKKEWKVLGLVTAKSNQMTAFTILKKSQVEKLEGTYWIFPVAHSGFYEYKNSKLIKKERFYDKQG